MKIHNVPQGSPEWLQLRSGIPTASEFNRILTPGGKPSKQAEGYMHSLLAEWIVGHPFQDIETKWMERGEVLEAEAVKAYAFETDSDPEPVGFVTNDAGTAGASPDRLVGADRLLEIKCPKHSTHVGYMLTRRADEDYIPQLQGQLWITGRKAVDIVSYHPEMGAVIVAVTRDEEYIAKLEAAVDAFIGVMLAARVELEERYGPFIRVTAQKPADADPFGITDADVDAIWAASQAGRAEMRI